jgi:hypothetical protein
MSVFCVIPTMNRAVYTKQYNRDALYFLRGNNRRFEYCVDEP